MGYSLRQGLLDATFVTLAIGFALAAAHLAWPAMIFLIGILAIAGTYGFVGHRYIDLPQEEPARNKLTLTDQSLLFIDWRERRHAMHWDQVARIGFSRYESLFPDPWIGDYMEEYWFLVDGDDKRIEIPRELGAKHDLAETLGQRFADFDKDLAEQALRTKEEGQWVLWRGPERAAS